MESIRFCTLTGVDEKTNLPALARLSRAHPISEWGVLFSRERMKEELGQGRYPRQAWIKEFAKEASDQQIRTALHLCGPDALAFLRGDEDLMAASEGFGRVQLNVRAKDLMLAEDLGVPEIARFVHHHKHGYGRGAVIIQNNENNAALCRALNSVSGLEFLVDGSGGRGQSPENWPSLREFHGQRYGFAGGLGADNLPTELEKISLAASHKPYWIDMEGKLRNAQDRFVLSACESVLTQTEQFMVEKMLAAGDLLTQTGGASPTSVNELTGFWLDWWSGLAAGYAMVVPPENASRPMYLSRSEGTYSGFQPSEYASDLEDALEGSEVGCVKVKGQAGWFGVTSEGEKIEAPTRELAMLKAMLVEELGASLPANPAHHPTLISHWLGSVAADSHAEMLATKKSNKVKP